MYMIRKSLAVVLVLLLFVGIIATPAYAAGKASDGVAVSLTTDKNEYAKNETITATLTVKNTNDTAVKDVSLESIVPAGYVLAEGDKAALKVDTLAAGEAVTLTVRFVPAQSEDPAPDTPTTDDDTPPEEDPPTTGDFSMVLWMVLLVLALTGVILLAVKYRVWKQVLSLVLCLSMLASLVAGVPFSVNAAEGDAKTLDISTTVKVDGKPVDISARVTYTLPDTPDPVYHTVRFDLDYENAPQIDAQQVPDGECAKQPEGVVREGYKFAYWCVKTDTGVKMIDLSQPVTEDLTLYARWVREGADSDITYTTYYNISFGIPDGYTEEDVLATIMPEDQVIHEGALVCSLPTPYREGYAFVGWCTDGALAKPISTEAIVTGDMVLYPMMVSGSDSETGMFITDYVADEDVTDPFHTVTVKAPSLQAVKDGIDWVDVANEEAEVEFDITDNGDGTYTLTPKEGLIMGRTYQLRAMDREQLPESADSYIRFFHNGERQNMDVRYYNIFTLREEVNNMRLANGIIFLPIDQVQGLDMETASSLFTLQTSETGEESVEANENKGTFTYSGSKTLAVGDIVAIYEGDAAVEEEYRTSKTVGSAKNTAFLKIVAVDGNTYAYGSPDIFDTLYVPEVLPIPLGADTDGNAQDNTITVADSVLDYRYFPVETILDENTTADVGDFIAIYSGTVDAPGDISYGQITSVESRDGYTTLAYESVTLDQIQSCTDSFVHNKVPAGLTEDEILEMENQAVQQALESGFAEQAAALAVQEKFGLDEIPVWGQTYEIAQLQSGFGDYEPEFEDVEIEAGTFVMMFTFDRPELSVDITENLQRITTIRDGLGMRMAFGVYVGIGVEVVNVWTNQVSSSFTLDMYVTLEQELALDMDVTLDADVELFLGFIPTDAWARLDVTFDVGTYSGVGIVATGGTEVGHTKEYIWDQLVKNDGSNGAFTSSESLADQLNDMLSEGDTSFFDQYSDKEGRSTLIQEYREMLQRETDYVDILALGRRKPFKIRIIPNVPVAEVLINPQLVFSAKLNVTLGTSFEYLDVKQYGYCLYMSLSDGARAWQTPVVDKQTPYHSFNLLMFGNVGVRAGFRLDLSIGVPVSGKDYLSKHFKLCELGTTFEIGVYVDLYGFGYYHFDKNRATGATNIQKAGAFYMEMGMYVTIDIYASALLNLVGFNSRVLEMRKPFYKDDKREYIYDVSLMDDVQEEYSRTYLDRNWYKVNTRGFRVKTFDLKSGDINTRYLYANQYAIIVPEEYRDKIDYMEYDVNGNFRQAFWVRPDEEEPTLEIKLQVVLKEAMPRGRANSLDSLYDLIEIPSDVLTIRWSRGKENVNIQYESKGPSYYNYSKNYYWTSPGNQYVTVKTIQEGDAIPKLSSINHLAPKVPGMDFSGWKVSCKNNAELDGKFITDISELQGYLVTIYDVQLHPQYVPRDDTPYTVRHWIPTLDDSGDYEIFLEEEFTGRTHSRVDCSEHYLLGHAGTKIDHSKYPLQTMIYDDNGDLIYFDCDVLIRSDGETVIDLYYERNECLVKLMANNPDFDYYGTVAATVAKRYRFGEAVTDPGYAATEIPGYTFLGWSTTADGSSGIFDALPDSLDFTAEQEYRGIVYYAIWEPETVTCKVNYYLLDPYGVYQFQSTEYHELTYGTKLYTSNLKPMELELPEDAYGDYAEAFYRLDGVTYAYAHNHIYKTGGATEINVYYRRSFSRVYFDYELSYFPRYETITLPAVEKTGYRFLGWKTNIHGDNTLYPAGQSLELQRSEYYFNPVFVEADDVKYTVEHYKQLPNGSYSDLPTEVQELYGTTNSTVTPAPMEYTGFETPAARSIRINADGTAVLAYYYARKTFDVYVDFRVEGESVGLDGRYPGHYLYGVPFMLSNPDEYPLNARREGYKVVGWYLADAELNPDQIPLGDDYWVEGDALFSQKKLVFKPIWEKVAYEYRVEHYLQQLDGSYTLQQTDKLTGYMNDTVTAQSVKFTGFTWDTANGDSVLSGTVTTDGSLVLKLYYTRNSYEVKWYAYDGITLLATTQVKYRDTITPPETYDMDSTRRGYTMTGWKASDYGVVTAAGASFTTADKGLWTANPYTVTFQANGGQGTMADQSFTYDAAQKLTANGFVRPGYTFAGWSNTSTGSAVYADKEQVENLAASGVVTLFAVWNAGTETPYRVEHYGQTLDGGWALLSEESLAGMTDTTATATASDFTGFTYDVDAANVTEGNIAGDGSLVLKLYYSRNSYTLRWLDDDGSLLVSQSVLFEAPVVAPESAVPSRTGYTFLGWNVSGTMPAQSTSFSAREDGNWAANTYTVSFYPNGGNGTMEAQSFTYDQAQLLRANGFTRPGYIFIGWSTEPGGQTVYTDQQQVSNLATSGNVELYAVWTAGDGYGYTVEHYVQQLDGSYAVDTTTNFSGVMDSEVTATAISIQGFTFVDDHGDNVLSGKINAEGTLVLKLYYDRNSYTATLVDDSGNQLASWQVKYGAAVTAPADAAVPVREGYSFGGWAALGTMPAENMTYSVADYGSWNANSYTVIFDANGGEGKMDDQPFTYDKAQTLTANGFTRAGYIFAGWSLVADGEVKYADQEQVTNLASSGEVTLYAQWTADASDYKVVYYGEKLDGTGFEEIMTENLTGKTDSDVSVAAIAIEGFTYDASNSGNAISGTITGDGSLVLKLYYTRNSYTLTLDFNGESMKQAVMDWNIGKSSIIGFDVADQTVTLKYGQTLAEVLTGITVPVMTEEGYEIWDEEVGDYVEVEPVYEDMAFETAFPGYVFSTWDGICDTMPARELTLTAQWTPITITVTFHSGYSYGYAPGVTGTAITKTYSYGDSILIPEHDFAWSEHTITGWKLGDGSGGFGQYPDIVEMPIELVYGYYDSSEKFSEGDTLDLFPYWTSDDDLITVEFNGNGAESGTMAPFLLDGFCGGSLATNKFRREGYTFIGWNTAPDGSGTSFADGDWIDLYSADGNSLILYAQWEEDA